VAGGAADPQNLTWVIPAEERVRHDTVIVVAGGTAAPLGVGALPAAAPVVAADEGVDRALAAGLRVDVAVGDFDSVSPAGLEAAAASGARVVRHPAAKEATDLELALEEAAALRPRRLVVVGADGGRLDHLFAGVLALGAERYAAFEVDALLGPATAHVVRGERLLRGRPGELVSLLALHGPAQRVVTEGLVYPLRGETLLPGSSRGVSNVFAAEQARVVLERGVLLALRPGPERSNR
jgi:thiamine pyrophosphokinase